MLHLRPTLLQCTTDAARSDRLFILPFQHLHVGYVLTYFSIFIFHRLDFLGLHAIKLPVELSLKKRIVMLSDKCVLLPALLRRIFGKLNDKRFKKAMMPACLPVCLSIYLSIYLSLYLSIYLSIYPYTILRPSGGRYAPQTAVFTPNDTCSVR